MTEKLFCPLWISLVLLVSPGVYASGAYMPSISSSGGADYNKGKAIFNGRVKLGNATACKDCHASEHRFQRGRLKEIKSQIPDKITSCEIHQSCYQGVISEQQIDHLVNYIIQRYRLN